MTISSEEFINNQYFQNFQKLVIESGVIPERRRRRRGRNALPITSQVAQNYIAIAIVRELLIVWVLRAIGGVARGRGSATAIDVVEKGGLLEVGLRVEHL